MDASQDAFFSDLHIISPLGYCTPPKLFRTFFTKQKNLTLLTFYTNVENCNVFEKIMKIRSPTKKQKKNTALVSFLKT